MTSRSNLSFRPAVFLSIHLRLRRPWPLGETSLWLSAALALSATPVMAATFTVNPDGSGDFATIRDAVQASADGDEIVLGDGVFNGEGNWDIGVSNKFLTIRSAAGVPSRCVIDLSSSVPRVGFVISGPRTDETLLEGITIRNGQGALRLTSTSMTIRNCRFRGNEAGAGGAILVSQGSPKIESCVFIQNLASEELGDFPVGGAIAYTGQETLEVRDCEFSENRAEGFGRGGAIVATGNLRVIDSVFRENHAELLSGAIESGSDLLEIDGCSFIGNTSNSGGAVRLTGNSLGFIRRCDFIENEALFRGGSILYESTQTLVIEKCLFDRNEADEGGGVSALGFRSDDGRISECTFYGNLAETGGAVHAEENARLQLDGCVLAFNAGGGAARCVEDGVIGILCSNVFMNVGGDWADCIASEEGLPGNISADPLFCDPAAGDFGLQLGSPSLPPRDSVPSDCGQMGAFGLCTAVGACCDEATQDCLIVARETCDLGGDRYEYLGDGTTCEPNPCEVAGAVVPDATRSALLVRPNVFRDHTTVEFELLEPGKVVVEVLDVSGRHLQDLYSGYMASGRHLVPWVAGGEQASGVYFVRVRTERDARTERALILGR